MWTENKEKKKEKAHIKHNVCTYDELIKLNSNRQRKIKRRASLTVLRPVQTNTGGDSPPDRSPVFTHILQGKGEGVYRPAPCKCDLIYILPTLCHILSAVVRNWPPALTSTLHSCTAPEWSESGHRHSFIPAVVVVNLSCVFKVLKRKKRSRINLFFLNGDCSRFSSGFQDMWDGYRIRFWHYFTVTCRAERWHTIHVL